MAPRTPHKLLLLLRWSTWTAISNTPAPALHSLLIATGPCFALQWFSAPSKHGSELVHAGTYSFDRHLFALPLAQTTMRIVWELKYWSGLENLKSHSYLKLNKKNILVHSIPSDFVVPRLTLADKTFRGRKNMALQILWFDLKILPRNIIVWFDESICLRWNDASYESIL